MSCLVNHYVLKHHSTPMLDANDHVPPLHLLQQLAHQHRQQVVDPLHRGHIHKAAPHQDPETGSRS